SSAAGDLAIDLAAQKRARGRSQDRPGGPLSAGVDRPAGECARGGADDESGRPVRLAAIIAAVVAAPVTDAVVGGIIAALLLRLRSLPMRRRPWRRIGRGGRGEGYRHCGGGDG